MGASNVKRREHFVGEEIASNVREDLLQFYLVEGGGSSKPLPPPKNKTRNVRDLWYRP